MSYAEALLNSIAADDDISTRSSYVEVEPHIVIGIDRFITVPDSLKRIAVQYDHNMRTVTFDCPRYYDGRDMASMKVYVNYINLNDKKVKGSYAAENVVVDSIDSRVMHFDWTIKSPVTQSKGKLAFLVCIRKVDSEGIESNHWNSELNSECYISEGMEFDSETIQNEYPDIVTQLLERMDVVETLATPEAMQGYTNDWLEENHAKVLAELKAKGEEVLATIPADYTETSNLAADANANSRTKADAITRTVEGSAITVDDSSDDHLRGLRIFGKTTQVTTTGKNLFTVSEEISENGITWDDVNQRLHIASGSYGKVITLHNLAEPIPAGTTVTLTLRLDQGYIATGGNVAVGGYSDPSDGSTSSWQCHVVIPITTDNSGKVYSTTYTTTSDINRFVLFLNTPTTVQSEIVLTAQFEIGNVSTEFERYSGGLVSPCPEFPQELTSVDNPTISLQGVNLFGGEVLADKIVSISKANTSVKDSDAKTVTYSGGGINKGVLIDYGFKKNTQYTLILHGQNTTATSGYINLAFTYDDGSTGYGAYQFKTHGEDSYAVMTSIAGKTVTSVIGKWASGEVCLNYEKCGLFEGTITEVDFVPFVNAQTITANYILHGIGDVRDEIDFERGVYIQRIGRLVLDGSAEWVNYNYQTMYYGFTIWNLLDEIHVRSPGLCNQFTKVGSGGGNTVWVGVDNPNIYAISKEWYDKGLDAWKAHLNEVPLEVVYTRVNPIETPLSAEELAWYKAAYTNYHNTTVINSSDAEMEFKYNADTEIWINNLVKTTSPIKSTTVTLSASKWVDTTYGYSQVVTMNGITPNSKVDLQPSPDQLADLTENNISLTTSNDNGVVTIHAIGSHPSSDMTVQVQITEVIHV